MKRASIAAVVVVLAASGTLSARARADVATDIDAGEAAYVALDYDKAATLAQKAVATRGLTHEQVVRAYRLLGRTYAVLGRSQPAIDAFEKLLTYAPDEKTDRSQPPRIQEAFAEAEGFWAGYPTRAGIEATTVAMRVGYPTTLRVRLHDPTHQIKKVVAGYRWGGTGAFTTADFPAAATINVDVPAGPPAIARFDYYVVALDGMDDQAMTVGDATTPKTVLADLVASTASAGGEGDHAGGSSVFASPVFWIVAGAVVAGGATSAYFALRKPTDVTGPPTSATLSGSLFCGGTADGRCH